MHKCQECHPLTRALSLAYPKLASKKAELSAPNSVAMAEVESEGRRIFQPGSLQPARCNILQISHEILEATNQESRPIGDNFLIVLNS